MTLFITVFAVCAWFAAFVYMFNVIWNADGGLMQTDAVGGVLCFVIDAACPITFPGLMLGRAALFIGRKVFGEKRT